MPDDNETYHESINPPCPSCEKTDRITETPEAGYWLCNRCCEPGSGPIDDINWWTTDPDSMWYGLSPEADA